jgi:hypothetical protein
MHDVIRVLTRRLLRRLVNGAQNSKQIEKRNNELGNKKRAKGTRYVIPMAFLNSSTVWSSRYRAV